MNASVVCRNVIKKIMKRVWRADTLESGIAPARRTQLLYDLVDGVDLLLVIGR